MKLAVGDRVGSFEIRGELGRGGMGVVFRALDTTTAREVALKTISGFEDRESVELFLREARAASRAHHPGIVEVLRVEEHAGTVAIALELVRGGSLSERIARRPLDAREAAALGRDLARAVAAAHEAGVVHRDLKPANVLLGDGGRPRLVDFGIARDANAASLMTTGEILGTPEFMAPEQARGDRKAIGPRTDVHGLGVVLYAALTGRAPFEAPMGIAVLAKVIGEPPEPIASVRAARGLAPVEPELERIVAKALEKDPSTGTPRPKRSRASSRSSSRASRKRTSRRRAARVDSCRSSYSERQRSRSVSPGP